MEEKILILDFGSQYTQLIARRIRELNIYCEIYPYHHQIELDDSVKGVVLGGSPSSVHDKNFPSLNLKEVLGKKPVLGICYGAQLISHLSGGKVEKSNKREYGRAHLHQLIEDDILLQEVEHDSQVWMSHADTVTKIPEHSELIARTESIPVAEIGRAHV